MLQLPEGLRGTVEDDLHVTLAYLGQADPAEALLAFEAAVERLQGPIEARASGWALLGPARRPWAVALELAGEGLVGALSGLRDPCRALVGLEPESRPVRPHLTLGAIPRSASEAFRREVAEWVDQASVPRLSIPISSVALYTHASEGRARYAVVQSRGMAQMSRGR